VAATAMHCRPQLVGRCPVPVVTRLGIAHATRELSHLHSPAVRRSLFNYYPAFSIAFAGHLLVGRHVPCARQCRCDNWRVVIGNA